MKFKVFLTSTVFALSSACCSVSSSSVAYDCVGSLGGGEHVGQGPRLELRNAGTIARLVRNPSEELGGFVKKAKKVHDASVKEFLGAYPCKSDESDDRFSDFECLCAGSFSKLSNAQKKILILYLECVTDSVVSELDDPSEWPSIFGGTVSQYRSYTGETEYNYAVTKRLCSDYINDKLFTGGEFNYEYVAQKILGLKRYSAADVDKIFASFVINFCMRSPTLLDVLNACVEDMEASYSRAVTYGWNMHNMSIPKDLFLEKLKDEYSDTDFMADEDLLPGIDALSFFTKFIMHPDSCKPEDLAGLSVFDFDELRNTVYAFKAGMGEEELNQALASAAEMCISLWSIGNNYAKHKIVKHAYPNFAPDVAQDLSKHDAFEEW